MNEVRIREIKSNGALEIRVGGREINQRELLCILASFQVP